jgi:hypothetical protein
LCLRDNDRIMQIRPTERPTYRYRYAVVANRDALLPLLHKFRISRPCVGERAVA